MALFSLLTFNKRIIQLKKMKIPIFIFLFLFSLTTLSAIAADNDDEKKKKQTSYFLIGNSLTWDTVPPKLDGDTQWHVDCGKSLPFMYANPEKPCVKSSNLWPDALKKKQYDFLSLQCHYGSTLEKDAVTISQLIELQPKATVVIHTGWARSAQRVEEAARKTAKGSMAHSKAYFDALLELLKKNHPDRQFKRTYAMDCLEKVARDVKEGKAPFQNVTELYRDKVHMNVVTGRYMMHNAMRAALGQPRSSKGFEKLDPELKVYFDSVLDAVLPKE